MKRIVAIFIAGVILPVCAHAEITLEECLEKAEANYPLIEKYELVEGQLTLCCRMSTKAGFRE